MKVLVTGGAGYIGSEIVQRLTQLEAVSQVVVYDNFAAGKQGLLGGKFNRAKLRIVKADILDSRTLAKEISGCSMVVHAAGIGNPYTSNDFKIHQLEQVNHWGTAELVHALETNAPQAYLIYLSSTEALGATNHTSAYASSVTRAEEEIERLVKKKLATILRLADVFGYGTNLRTDTLLNKMITDGFLIGKIQIVGSGNVNFDFTRLEEVVGKVESAISGKLSAGIFNLVSHSSTLNMVVEELSSLMAQPDIIYTAHHFEMTESNAENALPLVANLTLSEALSQFHNKLKE